MNDLAALGMHHLEARAMTGDPWAEALFKYVRELEAENAKLRSASRTLDDRLRAVEDELVYHREIGG
jgi:hypothetical protein